MTHMAWLTKRSTRATVAAAVLTTPLFFAAACGAKPEINLGTDPSFIQACATSACGPALGTSTQPCVDGSVGGATGRCLKSNGGTCAWEVRTCPASTSCTAAQCGPAPGQPSVQCSDGSFSGPTGVCEKNANGTCAWQVRACPGDPCSGVPVPTLARVCSDGTSVGATLVNQNGQCVIEYPCPSGDGAVNDGGVVDPCNGLAVPAIARLCPDGTSVGATLVNKNGQCMIEYPCPSGGDASVDAACTGGQTCASNQTFDVAQCKCVPVPSADAGACKTAADCKGPLPAGVACRLCPDGITASCIGHACVGGACTLAFGSCPSSDAGTSNLKWYTTCGDPVCRAPSDGGGTDSGVTACPTTAQQGGACSTAGAKCDFGAGCGVLLECAATDPKRSVPGRCPISTRSSKKEIEYLSPSDEAKIASDLEHIRLANYAYKNDSDSERRHLGFIIEDQPLASPAIAGARDMVDLYGYTSMVVAAMKVQAREIEALKAEVRTLQTQLPQRCSHMK